MSLFILGQPLIRKHALVELLEELLLGVLLHLDLLGEAFDRCLLFRKLGSALLVLQP